MGREVDSTGEVVRGGLGGKGIGLGVARVGGERRDWKGVTPPRNMSGLMEGVGVERKGTTTET